MRVRVLRYFCRWKEKFAHYNAQIGVHGASDERGKETVQSNAATVGMARVIKELGVPASIVGKMVVTPPDVWLTVDDLRSMETKMFGKPNQLQSDQPSTSQISPLDLNPNAQANAPAREPMTWDKLVDGAIALSARQNNGQPNYGRLCQPELKSIYASDFETEIPRLGTLRYLKLHIQEPEAYGIYRLATVELNATGTNDVRVQGIQESWVTGKAESLAGFIREREKSVTSTLKKYGLNVNGILLLAALIALPELSLSRRAIFTVAVFAIIAVIAYLHSRLIPNALIYLSAPKPNLFQRIWPPTLSWLFTIGGAVIGAIIYGLLKGEISVPGWLHFW
jgi:hypothetical protein